MTPYRLVVRRLLRLYDPWAALGLTRCRLSRSVRRAAPCGYADDAQRDIRYHAGRVLQFVTDLREGATLEAIEVDNTFDRGHLTGIVLLDGHHRLIAAALTRQPRIDCSYGGRVDLLRWLEGRSHRLPLELG